MLDEVFEGLGLKEEEVKIYLALLDLGPITVGQLAKEIGTPRPSLYGYLDRLHEMGLVSEDDSGTVKLFYAESIDRLNILYMKKMSDLRSRQKLLQTILPELQGQSAKHYIKPRLEHFEGQDAFLSICDRMLNHGITKVRSFGLIPTEPFFKAFDEKRAAAEIVWESLIFLPQIFDLSGSVEKGELRSMDAESTGSMTYLLFDSAVISVSTKNQFKGYVIDHRESVELYKVKFELIWKNAHPISC